MRTVTKRELNQNTATVLSRVAPTQDVVVTERGVPRWRLSAVSDHESSLARHEREGRYTPPASAPAPWSDRAAGPAYDDAQVDVLLSEVAGDH